MVRKANQNYYLHQEGFLGNVNNGSRNKCLNFGDVLDLKIKGRDQRLRGFDHNVIFYVMESCSTTAYTYYTYYTTEEVTICKERSCLVGVFALRVLQNVENAGYCYSCFQINCIFFITARNITAMCLCNQYKNPKNYFFTHLNSLEFLIGELLPFDGKQVKQCYLANFNTKLF